MDQGTQQNAATVEESSAASHSLASELGSLLDQLGQFRVGRLKTMHAEMSRLASAPMSHSVARPAKRGSNVVTADFAAHAHAHDHQGSWEEF
jgi:methyl-accepting chemotaxis protein